MTKVSTLEKPLAKRVVAVLLLWPLHAAIAEPLVTEREDRIVVLLSQAKRALAEDRLTVPSGDNAVSYAQRILQLAPSHPVAHQILRNVVARYERIAGMALDRAETLRAREIEKARTYGDRGERVARRYQLSDLGLRQARERIAALGARPEAAWAGPPERHSLDREILGRVVGRYLDESGARLAAGDVAAARRYQELARDLAQDYRLADEGLSRLERQIAEAEQRALALLQAPLRPAERPGPSLASDTVAPFLAPAF